VKDKGRFYLSLLLLCVLLLPAWVLSVLEYALQTDWGKYGILPRHLSGLSGILFSPWIHGDWNHLLSNSFPFLVLGMVLLNAYPRAGLRVLLLLWPLTGMLVWAFAPNMGYHIGASGIIYGMTGFLIFSGMIRGKGRASAIAIFVVLMYGGLVFGLVPMPGVSWESHFFGAAAGGFLALLFRKYDPEIQPERPPEDLWEEEKPFFERFPEGGK
jgi:membrane associated rhomboid family serine protease